MTGNASKPIDPTMQPGFFLDQHFLTDLSFESPRGPVPAKECENIQKKLEAEVTTKETEGSDMVLLNLTLEAKYQQRTAFLCEITYCAYVTMNNIPEQVKSQILNVSVPISLIPFLNNAIDHAAKAAGYPGINISHIDFQKIFQEKTSGQPIH
ncbi:protein-export chaperone SecB [Methylomarinum vadi]|uniref:protein-export chaperone SecB n=1 Tax=Methylomarinum vadi TaxID=438855 RepID=UPI0004DF0275|nr:protein-export chaperone SecB [Methylomarinum vadi]